MTLREVRLMEAAVLSLMPPGTPRMTADEARAMARACTELERREARRPRRHLTVVRPDP